jgi:hypothetical protein
VEGIKHENVKIVRTKFMGQVAQRLEGFRSAAGEFIFQTDDDIIFDRFCLHYLMNSMKSIDKYSAISPEFRFIETNQSVYSVNKKGSLLKRCYYWIINGKRGYEEGIVTLAGTECGNCPEDNEVGLRETEWLPGGGVLHHKTNLVLDNYFPFVGKAYCEDLFHSYYLRLKGISLFIHFGANAYLYKSDLPVNIGFKSFFNNLYCDYRIRKAYVLLSKRNIIRLYFHYIIRVLSFFKVIL